MPRPALGQIASSSNKSLASEFMAVPSLMLAPLLVEITTATAITLRPD
jgi:hypothetical protein